mgnify:FL=1
MKQKGSTIQGMFKNEWVHLEDGTLAQESTAEEISSDLFPKVIPFLRIPDLLRHRALREEEVERQIAARTRTKKERKVGKPRKSRKRKPKVPLHLQAMFDALPEEKREAMLEAIASV